MPTLQFHTAGVRVALKCADTAVAELVAEVGSSLLACDDGSRVPDVTVKAPPLASADVNFVAAQALSLVDRAALRSTQCLTVHAAALAGPAGAVVVPGASGIGKTTLAAAAMQCGLTLLSDEAACFTSPVGTLLPHPRPLGLSRHSRSLLGLADVGCADEQATATVLFGQTAPSSWRGPCVVVAVPDRRPGATASLTPLAPAEALPALLSSCLNVPPSDPSSGGWQPADAWRYLSDLVTRVRLARLTFDDPHTAASLLAEALGEGGVTDLLPEPPRQPG